MTEIEILLTISKSLNFIFIILFVIWMTVLIGSFFK